MFTVATMLSVHTKYTSMHAQLRELQKEQAQLMPRVGESIAARATAEVQQTGANVWWFRSEEKTLVRRLEEVSQRIQLLYWELDGVEQAYPHLRALVRS